ncbi:hypothetical protein AOQ84DRAFT_228040 [Glonium stellatum]|uniref:Uncharacterized protein n=1 Tax=Glonium stellatum TaxID=574774 RepID=A0A8E2JZM6_9PEZI|nr:hypothetical protein AOQ84DRAFT_228040 [Glonium stellatum]
MSQGSNPDMPDPLFFNALETQRPKAPNQSTQPREATTAHTVHNPISLASSSSPPADRIEPRVNSDEDELRSDIEAVERLFGDMIKDIKTVNIEILTSVSILTTTLKIAQGTLINTMKQGLGTVEQRNQARAELDVWRCLFEGIDIKKALNREASGKSEKRD